MLISVGSLRSDRGNVLAQRGILDGSWQGHLSRWGCMPCGCSVRTTGGQFFCIIVVQELIALCVLQQIEEDYASEGEGESIRFGTTFAGILVPISLELIIDKWHARM